jgi:hypothetical protein
MNRSVSAKSRQHTETTRKAQQTMTKHQKQDIASLPSRIAHISRIRKIFLTMTSFIRFVLCIGAVSGIIVLRVAGIITIPWWLVAPAILLGLAIAITFMSVVESVGNAILDAGIKHLHNKNRKQD